MRVQCSEPACPSVMEMNFALYLLFIAALKLLVARPVCGMHAKEGKFTKKWGFK